MEDNIGSPLMENANENRNQLVESLNGRIVELGRIISYINSEKNNIIVDCIQRAQKDDVNYVPDRTIVEEFLQLKGDLNTVKEKLQSLSLTEDTIFDEDKYLIAAEKLMERYNEEIERRVQDFKMSNKKKLEEARNRKVETTRGLANAEIELNHVNLEKEELEEQIAYIRKGIIYRIKSKLFNKEGNAKTEEIDSRIVELEKKSRDLKIKMKKLKAQEKVEHFVPNLEDHDDNQNTNREEREEMESEK